jgi:hypothetical protein
MATNRFLLALLACAILPAATKTICDSGCDYTTANLQTALTDLASCGNHLQLKAQATPYPPVYLPGGTSRQCANDPNYLENFNMSALPPEGAVVTPAYVSLMPLIEATAARAMALWTQNGNADPGGPANGWVIRGIRFGVTATRGNNTSCFITFGQFDESCSTDPLITTQADMPHNITFRSNFIQIDPRSAPRRCISVDAVGLEIRDSWIDCITPTFLDPGTHDAQAIIGSPVGTPDRYVQINNNVVIGTTTTITFGGYPSAVHTPGIQPAFADTSTSNAQYINITNNHDQHPESQMQIAWTPNTWTRIGQAVRPSTGYAGKQFVAVTTGRTGGIEPNWQAMALNSTVTDGEVTWFYDTDHWLSGCSYGVKNHFETKSGIFINVLNNFMDRVWAQCATGGGQGRSLVPEIQSAPNGGGSAASFQSLDLRNNIATNISAAIGTLYQGSTDDANAVPRFFSTAVEPYVIDSSNDTLKISIDGQAPTTITLTHGTRTAFQIATEINAAGGGSAATRIGVVAGNWFVSPAHINEACSGSECVLLIQRTTGISESYPFFTDEFPNPWNEPLARAISIGPATGTTATGVLGLPPEGTNIYPCTNPYSLIWYGCGSGTMINFTNNLFQMRHDGLYAPFVGYVALANGGVDGSIYDHNTFDDPTGWHSSMGKSLFTPYGKSAGENSPRWSSKGTLAINNAFADNPAADYQYVQGFPNAVGVLSDWTAINFMCQTAIPNADLSAGRDVNANCDVNHLLGGFSHNLVPFVSYSNGTCSSGITCATTAANNGTGFNAYPNDNPNFSFNSISFRNKTAFDYTPTYDPASPQPLIQEANLGSDNRPVGVDMSQMNFLRLVGAPMVSDRAAIFTFNVTPPIQNLTGMFTVATDPYCYSPVGDMNPALFANPGWTGNDRFPRFGPTRSVVVGLNAPLTPNTEYFYCLEYQGYNLNGQFSTKRALSGTATVQAQTRLTTSTQGASGANNMIVEYGTSYSRATDTISGGATTTAVPCVVGGSVCDASFSVTAGVPIYYRYRIRNAANTVLITEPVNVQAPL